MRHHIRWRQYAYEDVRARSRARERPPVLGGDGAQHKGDFKKRQDRRREVHASRPYRGRNEFYPELRGHARRKTRRPLLHGPFQPRVPRRRHGRQRSPQAGPRPHRRAADARRRSGCCGDCVDLRGERRMLGSPRAHSDYKRVVRRTHEARRQRDARAARKLHQRDRGTLRGDRRGRR